MCECLYIKLSQYIIDAYVRLHRHLCYNGNIHLFYDFITTRTISRERTTPSPQLRRSTRESSLDNFFYGDLRRNYTKLLGLLQFEDCVPSRTHLDRNIGRCIYHCRENTIFITENI